MEYFLNNLYYSLWRVFVVFYLRGVRVTHYVFDSSVAFFLSGKLKERFINRQKRLMGETLQDIYNYKTGIHLTLFNQMFDGLYSIYLSLISLIVSAVLFRITRSFLFSASIAFVGFAICWIPLNRYVLNDKRYIKFFKEFERKDESWHKKWRRIAVTLIVLQLPIIAIGTLLAFMIVFAGLD